MMGWFPSLVFYMGLFDAGIIMIGGVAVAGMMLLGREVDELLRRVGPAVGVLIGSNIAAALILWATRALVG